MDATRSLGLRRPGIHPTQPLESLEKQSQVSQKNRRNLDAKRRAETLRYYEGIKEWGRGDLNPRSADYESAALTN